MKRAPSPRRTSTLAIFREPTAVFPLPVMVQRKNVALRQWRESTAREHRCRMVVTLGHISHICGNWKHKPKPRGPAPGANRSREYWKLVADNLSKARWSWGCVSAIDSCRRTIFVADAHRGDGKRYVVHADEKLT